MNGLTNLRFEQIPGRKEWIISGLDNGVLRCNEPTARELSLYSQAGRLWPFEVIAWQPVYTTDVIDGLIFDLTFSLTFDLKRLGE